MKIMESIVYVNFSKSFGKIFMEIYIVSSKFPQNRNSLTKSGATEKKLRKKG